MPDTVTLKPRTFTAARLRRIGGRLAFNDELIPVGTEVLLAHAMRGVASLILPGERLVPIVLTDVNDDTFEFVEEVPKKDANASLLRNVGNEVIPGDPLTVVSGSVLRRTGRPFSSLAGQTAPCDDDLTVDSVAQGYVFCDTSGYVLVNFGSRYLTDAYFAVVT